MVRNSNQTADAIHASQRAGVGLEMSRMWARFRMRRVSASVFAGSVKSTTRLMNAVSKLSSGKDVTWQSSTWNVTLEVLILSFATASMPGAISVAMTLSDFADNACV